MFEFYYNFIKTYHLIKVLQNWCFLPMFSICEFFYLLKREKLYFDVVDNKEHIVKNV